jgi:DNA-binding response OmpR family regulator
MVAYAKKVLVIDDERVVCNSCRRVLEQEGYEVSVAMDGHEGIERVSQEEFDAALVDLRLPGISGMDVVRAVKNVRPQIRIIIITGYSSISSAVEAMQLGASDYLPKPFTPNELTDRVRRAVESAARLPQGEVEEKAVAGAPAETVQPRILLAGSNSDQMVAICQSLFSEGYQVTTVDSRGELFGKLKAGQAEVLILGVDVLGTKAHELIAQIRRLGCRIPVIVASADPSVELAQKLREIGIFFYLMEPLDSEEVRSAVRDAVRKAEALRAEESGVFPRKALTVRSLRTLARNGGKVGFVYLGEDLTEDSPLSREILAELNARSATARIELGRGSVGVKEFPKYLEQDRRVVLIAPSSDRRTTGVVCYNAADFERFATKEERRTLGAVAYPQVLEWLRAREVAPDVRIVFLPREPLRAERAQHVARVIVGEGVS